MTKRPWRAPLLAALLLAAALVGLPQAAAQRGRRALRQQAAAPTAAADGAAPAPAAEGESIYGSPKVDSCIQLTNAAGSSCSVESDTLSLVYSRGSEVLPTPEETSLAIANMKAAAQPSQDCCNKLLVYAESRCVCDADYQQLLPIGGFASEYFIGATSILTEACGSTFPPCKPGEVATPDDAAKAGGKAQSGGR